MIDTTDVTVQLHWNKTSKAWMPVSCVSKALIYPEKKTRGRLPKGSEGNTPPRNIKGAKVFWPVEDTWCDRINSSPLLSVNGCSRFVRKSRASSCVTSGF